MKRASPGQTLGREAGVPATLALLRQWVDAGECMGGQIFVARDGHVVADVAVGSSGPHRCSSTKDVGRLYCAVKPITACCLARGIEAGEASFDDLVSRFLPDFSSGRRGTITLRQLLSHTSGLPNLPIVDPYDHEFPDLVRAACTQPLPLAWWYHEPAYNFTHAWNILAAVVERLYGQDLAAVVTRMIAMPAGVPGLRMTSPDPGWYVPCHWAQGGSFAVVPGPSDATLFRKLNPAHGGFGSARDLGLFYRELIRCAAGAGVLLGDASIREMTREHSNLDLGVGLGDFNYGLGFFADMRKNVTGGNWSARSFGHAGQVGRQRVVLAFGDPEHQVAVAIRLFSVGAKNNWRFSKLGAVLWSDLDLGPK
jgi:CubicO group peptidase (beta-lactamase class C family)